MNFTKVKVENRIPDYDWKLIYQKCSFNKVLSKTACPMLFRECENFLFSMIRLLSNNNQQIITDGHPYLCGDCILGHSVECFGIQMQFDPFEEVMKTHALFKKLKLNLPPKYLWGGSINAIEIHIWVKMIAFFSRVSCSKRKVQTRFLGYRHAGKTDDW